CTVSVSADRSDLSETVKKRNSEILRSADQIIEMPHLDVEICVKLLLDILSQPSDDNHILFVPMGPKTHVLTSLIAGSILPTSTCIRVSLLNDPQRNVFPTGSLSINSVSIRGCNENI
ncbi:MAG: hypothetical protein V1826_01250, partial [bacterium]